MSEDNIVRDLVVKIETDSTENIENNEESSSIYEDFQFISQEHMLDDASSTTESDSEVISDTEARNNDGFFSEPNRNFRSYSVSEYETDNRVVIAERKVREKPGNVAQEQGSSRIVPFQLNGGLDNELNLVPCTNLGVTKEVLDEERRFKSPVPRKVIFQSNNVSVNANVKPTIRQENGICNARNMQRKVDFHSMNAFGGKFSNCASQKLNKKSSTILLSQNYLQKKVCQSTSATNSELKIFEPCILSKIIREMLNEEAPVEAECENASSVSSSCLKTHSNVTNVPDAIVADQEKLEVNKPTERIHVTNIQQRISSESLNPETRTNESAGTYHMSMNPNQLRKRPMVRVEGVSLKQGNIVSASRGQLNHKSAVVSCSEVTNKQAKLEEKTNIDSGRASSIQQETVVLSSNKFDHLLASYAPFKFTEPQKMRGAVYEQQSSVDGSAVCRMDDFSTQDSISRSTSTLQRGKSKNAPAAPKKRILWTHKNPSVQDNQMDPIEMQIAVLCEPNTKLEIASLPLESFGQKSVLVLIPDDVIPVISESDNVIPVNGVPIVAENNSATSLTGNSIVAPNDTCELPVVMDNHSSVVMKNGNLLPATGENVIFVAAENSKILPIGRGGAVTGNNRVAVAIKNENVAPVAREDCETNNSLSSIVTENDSITAVVRENGEVVPIVMEDYSLATAEHNSMIYVVTDNSSNVSVTENDSAAPVTAGNGNIVPVTIENGIITLAGTKTDCLSTSTDNNDRSVVTLTKPIKSGSPQSHSTYELSTCSRCSDKFLNQPEPKKFRVCRTDEPPNTCKSCCARIKRANYLNSHMLKITNRRHN